MGIELRALTWDDLDEVCALTNRSEQFDGIPRRVTVEEMHEDLEAPHIDLALDTRAAYLDGQLAGWSWVWNPPSDESLERAYVNGVVDPEHRTQGVGRALMAWGLARAEERLRSRPHDLPRYVRVDSFEEIAAAHRLYSRFGFAPVRWFEECGRPLDDLPPVVVPDGVVLERWPEGRDEELRIVRNTAFADHWGTTPMTAASWQQIVHGHGARPDLSVIAVEGATGAVIGVCLNHAYPEDDDVTGRREAWIENVATVRAWRGRGVASALLSWSLAAFASAGFTHAMLGVDTDNPTGAARLYRDLGFRTERRSITHQIELTV